MGEASRRVLVTGATSGIGLATAIALARRGARVVVHGRSQASAAAAAGTVRRVVPRAQLETVHADLSSMDEVRALATKLTDAPPDVVIHNAGLERWTREETPDGLEVTFAVNHLAPYLCTRLLAPHLLPGAGVIFVSSMVHGWGTMHWDDLMAKRWYAPEPVYYQSKLAAALGADALARRVVPKSVDVLVVPPGLTRTAFARDFRGAAALWARVIGRWLFRPAEHVAEELTDAALSPRFAGVGLVYVDRGLVRLPSPCARLDADVRRLDRETSLLLDLPVEELPAAVARPELSPPALGAWARTVALGEALGFTVPVLFALVGMLLFGAPDSVRAHVLALVWMSVAGVLEGLAFGYFTWRALSGWLPDLDARGFVGATVAVAATAWVFGMAVPLYFTTYPPAEVSAGPEPSTAIIVGFAALFGAIAGALFGVAQSVSLRRQVRRVAPWIAGQAAGWAVGLPISYLAGGHWPDALGAGGALVLGALTGLAMGTCVALTSFAATRWMR